MRLCFWSWDQIVLAQIVFGSEFELKCTIICGQASAFAPLAFAIAFYCEFKLCLNWVKLVSEFFFKCVLIVRTWDLNVLKLQITLFSAQIIFNLSSYCLNFSWIGLMGPNSDLLIALSTYCPCVLEYVLYIVHYDY